MDKVREMKLGKSKSMGSEFQSPAVQNQLSQILENLVEEQTPFRGEQQPHEQENDEVGGRIPTHTSHENIGIRGESNSS